MAVVNHTFMETKTPSSSPTFSILLVDDSESDRFAILRWLNRSRMHLRFEFREAGNGALGLAMCRERMPDCLLLDYALTDIDGVGFLAALNAGRDAEDDPACPTVMLTGTYTAAQVAVRTLKGGAQNYLIKESLTSESIVFAIENAVEKVGLRRELRASEARFRLSLDNMLDCFAIYTAVRDGESDVIQDFRCDYVNEAACHDAFLTSEALAGSLLFAHSGRGQKPMATFEEYVQVLKTGSPLEKVYYSYSDPDFGGKGGLLTKAVHGRAWRMRDGFATVWRDVTAEKRSEAERAAIAMRKDQVVEAVQRSFLLVPPHDAYAGLMVQPFYHPASDEALIGGDFFDVFAVSEDNIALVVGDATGKGVEASTYTAEIKFALRAFLREHHGDLPMALHLLNDFVIDNERFDAAHLHGSYIALVVVLIDSRTGEVMCCCAGAEPPLILHRSTGEVVEASAFGPLLGASEDATYTTTRHFLAMGDMIALTTDGITEARQPAARNAEGRMRNGAFLGIEGLMVGMREEAADSERALREVGQAIVDRTLAWANGHQHDDICLLIAQRR